MKWDETIASKCRYGGIAEDIWGDAEIIWENSHDDYQGYATILAKTPDGKWWYYEWWYGSCAGCDTWEAAEMDCKEIEAEMRDQSAVFDNEDEMLLFLGNMQPSDDFFDNAKTAYQALINYVTLGKTAS